MLDPFEEVLMISVGLPAVPLPLIILSFVNLTFSLEFSILVCDIDEIRNYDVRITVLKIVIF